MNGLQHLDNRGIERDTVYMNGYTTVHVYVCVCMFLYQFTYGIALSVNVDAVSQSMTVDLRVHSGLTTVHYMAVAVYTQCRPIAKLSERGVT